MSVLGAIEVQMLLDMARWQNDVTNAGRVMDQGLLRMKQMASNALGGLVAGLGATAFAGWIRGAIDAADETSKMAQKMGVATRDVGGLALAMELSGIESGAMQTAMVKLSRGVAEGNEVFTRMGISVRNADGSLKSSKQVLYDVADVFETMPSGINRTALAVEVFGKSGADLVPLLAGGSEGLRDMADMAERLGLVIDEETGKAAEEFNDTLSLLGKAGTGMATQVAAQLLPTLKGLAGTLLDNVASGDQLQKASEGLAAVLKLLFTGGALGVEVFSTLGKTVAGVAGAVVAVAQGEFNQVRQILNESGRDIAKGWGESAKTIEAVWSGTASSTVTNAAAVNKALGGTTVATKAQADAAKKAAEDQAKLTKAGQDYLEGINAQYGAVQQQISLGRELTEAEKELIKLDEKLTQGKLVLTSAERAAVEIKLREIDAVKEQRRQADDYARTLAAVAAQTSKLNEEQIRNTETLRAGNVALSEENEKLRIGERAWSDRQAAVLLNQAADLEWQAASQGGNFQLEEQARLLRERARLVNDGTALKEAKAVADEWKRATDSIRDGLTDALMRGFESGKGFAENFGDVLKNAFKTLVLKPMVDEMVKTVTGGMQSGMAALSNWYYGGGGGSGGAGGGSGGGAAGGAGGAAAGLGWYSWILAGVMQSKSDYDKGWNREGLDKDWNKNLNWAINPLYGLFKGLESQGILNSEWADILGGDTAVARMFGRKPAEAQAQGVSGSFGAAGFLGQQFVDWKADGGWFRGDKTGTQYSALDARLGAALSAGTQDLLDQTTTYADALGLPVRALAYVTADARIELGEDAQQNAKAIAAALGLYNEALVRDYEAALATVATPGERATETLSRLGSALLNVNTTFEALGLGLVQTSVAGGQAASELIGLAGGLDSFLAKTQTYLGAYFTQSEQLGLGAKNVLRTLGDAGVKFYDANDRGDLRTLMESLDPNSATGREQIAALLGVAGDFARLTDYLAENKLTLGELAAQAPDVGMVLQDPAQRSATAAEESAAALQTSNGYLGDIAGGQADTIALLQAQLAQTSAANVAIVNQLAALSDALENAARMADLAPGSVPFESTGG